MSGKKKAELAAIGQISHTSEVAPMAKCPFCGKNLKHVPSYFGRRRYAWCHHCGRNAYDIVGGTQGYIRSLGYTAPEDAARQRANEAAQAHLISSSEYQECPECGNLNPPRRRCSRCGLRP